MGTYHYKATGLHVKIHVAALLANCQTLFVVASVIKNHVVFC